MAPLKRYTLYAGSGNQKITLSDE